MRYSPHGIVTENLGELEFGSTIYFSSKRSWMRLIGADDNGATFVEDEEDEEGEPVVDGLPRMLLTPEEVDALT